MPNYQFACEKCGHGYTEFLFMYEDLPERCPECKAKPPDFHQVYAGASPVGWVYGNPTTVGQQAEANAKRLGREQIQKIEEDYRNQSRTYTGKLPEGAEVITDTGETPPWRDGSMGLPKLDKPLNTKKLPDVKRYVESGK